MHVQAHTCIDTHTQNFNNLKTGLRKPVTTRINAAGTVSKDQQADQWQLQFMEGLC